MRRGSIACLGGAPPQHSLPAGSNSLNMSVLDFHENLPNIQLVVAKDEETRGLVARLMETVASIQESTSILAESRVIAHNIINTKIPPIKHSSQAYCIEVIQI